VVARLHLARGRPELAVRQLRRHIDRREDGVLSAPTLALLAEAEVAAARLDHARDVGERLEAIARATPVPLLRALAEFAAGIASTDDPADGRADHPADHAGIGHLEAALAGFLAVGLPFEEARTRLQLARCLSADQPEVAIAEARAALAVFDRIGAAPDADAAASLLRALGARGRTGPKGVGLLSQREQTVLGLLGEGLTNPEIAQRLFISPKTASHHVSNVLAKLGLRNRAEAAVVARSFPSHHESSREPGQSGRKPGQSNNAAPQAPAS
jgi:DNA-binding CsgD family transcriptional regulator